MKRLIVIALLFSSVAAMGQNDPNQSKRVFLKDTVFATPLDTLQAAAYLGVLSSEFKNPRDFDFRKEDMRVNMLYQFGLTPMPARAKSAPVIKGKQSADGYTIENIAIEILDGVWLYGNLYRPTAKADRYPAVMLAQGHSSQKVGDRCGRFTTTSQTIAGSLARMGNIVFSYDMFAYGESALQVGEKSHRTGLAQTMNVLGAIRVLDFLSEQPYVDATRIAMTGASGGGTQTYLATAVDDRIAVSIPVVQVSCYFPGGCPCESGRPILYTMEYHSNPAELAALAAPRPLLVISDGKDWTNMVNRVEYPYIKGIYGLYGKGDMVENVHFAKEGHDFGPNKRYAVYDFIARHFRMSRRPIQTPYGKWDESAVKPVSPESLRVFNEGEYPANVLTSLDGIYLKLKN